MFSQITYIDILILSLCVIWLVFTIFSQFGRKFFFQSFDIFHLIPQWTFFSPNPGRNDYQLVYHLKSKPDSWINLTEFKNTPATAFLLNANKLEKKCLIDIAVLMKMFERDIIENNESNIKLTLSWPYLCLLKNVSLSVKTNCNLADKEELQFAIIKNNAFINTDNDELTLMSEWHIL